MGNIRRLPPDLINHIAAGEVVERPASVIKELVENAMDAGATQIDIRVDSEGRRLRIADNGSGMGPEDLALAFENHATSKLKTVDDLFAISTLGFRGEALASISAISKVTCFSRTAGQDLGNKAVVLPGGEVKLSPAGCAQGTIFEVDDLFYNVPARLKFLKRPQTEIAHIQEAVQTLALSHPDIAFQLYINDALSLKTSGQGSLDKTLQEVFALGEQDSLLSVHFEDAEAGIALNGLTSSPNVYRSSKKWMATFVNGRAVKCAILNKAIESAYQSLMTPGKFPVCALFLTLPMADVDVNVHPAKREVKYRQPNTVFSVIRRGIDEALIAVKTQTVTTTDTSRTSSLINSSQTQNKTTLQSLPLTGEARRPSKTFASSPARDITTPSSLNSNRPSLSPQAVQTSLSSIYRPLSDGEPASSLSRPSHRIIGQLAKTYILVETESGLLIVDQHIAGERVLFERFFEQAERTEPAQQSLLVAMTFPVSSRQAALLEENHESFIKLGFTYELMTGVVSFSAVPAVYSLKTLKTALEGLLADLEHTPDLRLNLDDVIATAACHSAVRAGDTLNQEQMQRILDQWLACQRPWTCPHGRPVSYEIPHREIMAFFDRPSLPVL